MHWTLARLKRQKNHYYRWTQLSLAFKEGPVNADDVPFPHNKEGIFLRINDRLRDQARHLGPAFFASLRGIASNTICTDHELRVPTSERSISERSAPGRRISTLNETTSADQVGGSSTYRRSVGRHAGQAIHGKARKISVGLNGIGQLIKNSRNQWGRSDFTVSPIRIKAKSKAKA